MRSSPATRVHPRDQPRRGGFGQDKKFEHFGKFRIHSQPVFFIFLGNLAEVFHKTVEFVLEQFMAALRNDEALAQLQHLHACRIYSKPHFLMIPSR